MPRASLLARFGAFLFRYRNGLFPVVALAVLAVQPPRPIEAGAYGVTLLFLAGAVCALLGVAIRLWVLGSTFITRSGRGKKAHADRLVTEGLFAHARHPLYTGNLLISSGLWLAYGTPLAILGIAPLFYLFYLAMARNEETYLTDRFGNEYEAYMRSVRRFLPRARGIRDSMEAFRYDWRRAVRTDIGQMVLPVLVLAALGGWRYRLIWPAAVSLAVIVTAVTLSAWGLVLALRRAGRLASPADPA